jgi:hypothetical protein
MDDRERCPKNPSMLKAYCSHCQGTLIGSSQNPVYSLREHTFDGWPVVEVLKNGASIHPWDSHFRFGHRKAVLLVASISIIREFGWSSDGERLAFRSTQIEIQRPRLRLLLSVEMYPEFEYSTGETIERPWLSIQGLPPYNEKLGLGVMKCRAIAALEDDLRLWLRKQGVQDVA